MTVGWVHDFDVSDNNDHSIDMSTSDPQTTRLTVIIIMSFASLEGVESNDLQHDSLAYTVEYPSPESPSAETQIYTLSHINKVEDILLFSPILKCLGFSSSSSLLYS